MMMMIMHFPPSSSPPHDVHFSNITNMTLGPDNDVMIWTSRPRDRDDGSLKRIAKSDKRNHNQTESRTNQGENFPRFRNMLKKETHPARDSP